jgi:hypothetical protein
MERNKLLHPVAANLIFVGSILFCCESNQGNLSDQEFKEIAQSIAKGWNEGDASFAAKFFAKNAVYEEPPRKQFYKGYDSIFEFFGGANGFETPMHMTWHNLAFDENHQIGFGEYTFSMSNQYHGIVVMQFQNGKIIKWREYQYESDLEWKDFTGESLFDSVE